MRRQEFSAKTKWLAFQRAGGVCECGCTMSLRGERIDYDHRIACEMDGDNSLANCVVLIRGHHRKKTAQDATTIAKVKRLERRAAGIRKPRTITGWRKFDGTPVRASRAR